MATYQSLATVFLLAQVSIPGAWFRKDFFAGNGPPIAGDFNGDGRPDLLMADSILLNSGGGVFVRQTRSDLAGLGLVADFNNDGKLDLLASSAGSPRSYRVFLGRGDGTFLPPLPGIDAEAVAIGDFDSDGVPDLVTSFFSSWDCKSSPQIHILLGNGDGSFRQAGQLQVPCPGGGIPIVADFNRDGKTDVAFGSFGISVFPGRGDGTFESRIFSYGYGTFVVDLNGDGAPDIATSTGAYLGRGDGTFEPFARFPGSMWTDGDADPVAAGDFNGDGTLDLVVNDCGGTGTWMFPGKGDGTLLAPEFVAKDSCAGLQIATDFDGDGVPDLILWRSNAITLLLSDTRNRPSLARAVSAASGTAIVAPGSLATLYSSFPAELVESATTPWPTKLGGLSLEILDSAGAHQLAPLLYVSGEQINFMVPADVALGEASLFLVGDKKAVTAGTMDVAAVSPGVFLISIDDYRSADPSGTTLIRAYGTGFRDANRSNVTGALLGFFGGPQELVVAEIENVSPGETPGLDRIDIKVPVQLIDLRRPGYYYYIHVLIHIDGIPANAMLLAASSLATQTPVNTAVENWRPDQVTLAPGRESQ